MSASFGIYLLFIFLSYAKYKPEAYHQ